MHECLPGADPVELHSQSRIALPGLVLIFLLPGETPTESTAGGLERARAFLVEQAIRDAGLAAVTAAAESIQLAYRNRLLVRQLLRVAESERRPQANAAREIQRSWRGFAARTDGRIVLARERRDEDNAAIQIQKIARGNAARTRQRHDAAATRISAAWRGTACRWTLVERAEQLQWERAERQYSAKQIQSAWRGFVVRQAINVAELQYDAAAIIQAAARGWLQRHPIHLALLDLAAVEVQSAWRGWAGRRRVLLLRQALSAEEAEYAARVIQERALEFILRRRAAQECAEEEAAAATLIQSHARGWLVRHYQWVLIDEDRVFRRQLRELEAERQRELERQRDLDAAATVLQAAGRGWLGRAAYERKKETAVRAPAPIAARADGARTARAAISSRFALTEREAALRAQMEAIRQRRKTTR
eukprot:COSAG04_NODE_1545_length_6408_cov_2.554288_4_plen_420_part_00